MTPWDKAPPPVPARFGAGDWLRVLRRGAGVGAVTFGGWMLLMLVRLVERPLCGLRRPVSPWITQIVCRTNFRLLGMGFATRGQPLNGPGAVVANHASWLDIFALNARKRVYFVSKSEVARWPGIGWLARATGTVFIARDPRQAAAQRAVFEARLGVGHRLLFFPEGTSTDSLRVLPFKPTLFAAFFAPDLRGLTVQPVTLRYTAPDGTDPRFYGWWGDMEFGAHLLQVLAVRRPGRVDVLYHPPVPVAAFSDRKALAHHCETVVRAGLDQPPSSAA